MVGFFVCSILTNDSRKQLSACNSCGDYSSNLGSKIELVRSILGGRLSLEFGNKYFCLKCIRLVK